MIVANIEAFLINRGWSKVENDGAFSQLLPPDEMNFENDFNLHIPKQSDKADSTHFIENLLGIIGDIYSLEQDDLKTLIRLENSILKIRIDDQQTEEGKIALERFEELVDRVKSVLRDTASFVIDQDVLSSRVPEQAMRYLGLCNFMQTEKGSFVAKFQLPSKEIIQEAQLFDQDEIHSKQVNDKLAEVLSFVSERIFEGSVDMTEDFLVENENKINVKLYKGIENLFKKAKLKNLDFSLHSIDRTSTVINRNVTNQKLNKLNRFIEFVESQSYEIDQFTFVGQIVELKSKDPDGIKNRITFMALHDNIPIKVSAILTSDNYKDAVEAHGIKQNIKISGLAKKTKSAAKFIEIAHFSIEE